MSKAVIITGGGGFLGQCLATEILSKKCLTIDGDDDDAVAVAVDKMILADIFFPDSLQSRIEQGITEGVVQKVQGDVSDPKFVTDLYQLYQESAHLSVFHLGAVMSGDGERDFDLCMRVNLHGTINMLEGARTWGSAPGRSSIPKLVLASAGATIGSGAPTDYVQKFDTISDASRATPHTTYGATKACAELLLSDYGRRKLVDARGL